MIYASAAAWQAAHAQQLQALRHQQMISGLGNVTSYSLGPPQYPKIQDCGITVGEITGWRAWRVMQGAYIKSTYVEEVWAPDSALDGNVENGDGVHAWKSPHKALTYVSSLASSGTVHVVGQVALWGTVIEHERGYRGQYAKPISFDYLIGVVKDDEKMVLDALRTRYKIGEEK